MLLTSHRSAHPFSRMLLTILLLSSLARHCELLPIKTLTDASSSSSSTLSRNSADSRSHNLDSPSELAWQAWLLLDSQPGAHTGFDSSSFLRRITPKSVFIAPALPALPPCADGYRADTMGRCVKNVNIDHEAHLGFLLQRLNNRYGNRGGNSDSHSSNNQKKSNGPLQLNIPLLSNSDSKSTQVDHEVESTQADRGTTPDAIKTPAHTLEEEVEDLEEEKSPLETVVPSYEKNNASYTSEDEFFESISGYREDDTEVESSNNDQKESSGPLQLNFHLLSDSDPQSAELNHEHAENSVKIPPVTATEETVTSSEENVPLDTTDLIDEKKNGNETEEEEPYEKLGNDEDDNLEAQPVNCERKNSSGPFQLSIPLVSNDDPKSTEADRHEEPGDSIETPIVTTEQEVEISEEEKLPLETVETIYEGKNGNETENDEFFENFDAASSENEDENSWSKLDTVVPVAEFIDDMNDTSFSGVEYKIPIDLKTILNISSTRTSNASHGQDAQGAAKVLVRPGST